jgi:hypothetical protein
LAWTDRTYSHTTNANHSRFVLLTASHNSATSGVDFAPYIADTSADALGVGFFIDDGTPVNIQDVGDAII